MAARRRESVGELAGAVDRAGAGGGVEVVASMRATFMGAVSGDCTDPASGAFAKGSGGGVPGKSPPGPSFRRAR